MQRLITALLTTLSGACASTASRPASPTEGTDPTHGPGSPDPHHDHAHHDHAHHDHAHHAHHGFADAEALTKVFDDPSRDAWQHPNDVLRALSLEPTMVVADVGAGTGYFAVRLARAVPRGEVIATDIEPDMVRFLGERARRERLPQLRAILATEAASGLVASSVDRILVVHVWHHLANRKAYARDLATALRPGGRVVVVDFSASGERGPPANMRLATEVITAELESAGLSAEVSAIALPDQFIVIARRAP